MQETTSFSDWQKKYVPTFVLSAKDGVGSGYVTLQEAVDRAPPFAKIVLGSGTYTDSCTVSKPLEIAGDSSEEPIITGRGPCITLMGDHDSYIHHIRMRVRAFVQGGASVSIRSDPPPAVMVSGGRPTIAHCELTSITVTGMASPIVEHCFIHGNSQGSGISVRDVAGGLYRNNEITSHNLFCIDVSSRGVPEFLKNDIYCRHDDSDCLIGLGLVKIGGISAADPSAIKPLFSGNRIADVVGQGREAVMGPTSPTSPTTKWKAVASKVMHDPKATGDKKDATKRTVTAMDMRQTRAAFSVQAASPTIVECAIEGGKITLALIEKCAGVVEQCTISDAALCCIFADQECETIVKQTRINESKGGGAFLDSCSAAFSQCIISNCAGPGVSLSSCPRPSFEDCTIDKCRSGFALSGEGSAVIQNCSMNSNRLYGLRCLDPGCSPKIRDCSFVVNGPAGVHFSKGATPRFTGNSVCGSKVGVLVDQAANPIVVKSRIFSNEQLGVLVENNGRGHFAENMIQGSKIAGIKVSSAACPKVLQNTIMEHEGCGVIASEGAIGSFVQNEIRSCSDGFNISTYADPIVEDNEISACSRYGVIVDEEGLGTVVQNRFVSNHTHIGCMHGGEPVFRGNTMTNALHRGAYFGNGGKALVEKNIFQGSGGDQVVIDGEEASPVILKNAIRDAFGNGVHSMNGGHGLVKENVTRGNRGGGYATSAGGATLFDTNSSVEDVGPGIHAFASGKGIFRNCTISDAVTSGCVIAERGDPQIEDSVFRGCRAHGIEVRHGAKGHIERCRAPGNVGGGLHFSGICETRVDDFVAEDNGLQGVTVGGDAVCTLRKLICRGNTVGMRILSAGKSLIEECFFEKNKVGVLLANGGQAVVKKCKFTESTDAHVEFADLGSGTVTECSLDAGVIGARSHNNGAGKLDQCTIVGATRAGVLLENGGSTAIDSCVVRDCEIGVLGERNGQGVVSGCELHGNKRANAVAETGNQTLFRDCTMSNALAGFNIELYGTATFQKNEITSGSEGGVFVGWSADGLVESNSIDGNHGFGVVCGERSAARVFQNQIKNNKYAGVKLESAAASTIEGNTVELNDCFGIICGHNSAGTVRSNDVKRNKAANMFLQFASTTHVIQNTVVDGDRTGVLIVGGNNLFERNVIKQNSAGGVHVAGMSYARLQHNDIHGNTHGIIFQQRGPNEVTDVLHAKQCEALGSDVTARRRTVADATKTFVTGTDMQQRSPNSRGRQRQNVEATPVNAPVTTASAAYLGQNSISRNRSTGIMIREHAEPEIEHNKFSNDNVSIQIHETAAGSIKHNTFAENQICISIIGDRIATVITNNLFEKGSVGIKCSDNVEGSKPTVKDNRFLHMGKCGIHLTTRTTVEVTKNIFVEGNTGVLIDGEAKGVVTDCEFHSLDVGVHLADGNAGVVRRSQFLDNVEIGVLSSDGKGEVVNNVFSEAITAGVCCEKYGSVVVRRNVFARNDASDASCGFLCRKGGNATVIDNDFHENSVGIRAVDNGTSLCRNNFLHDNEYGAYATLGGQVKVMRCFFMKNRKADFASLAGARPSVEHCLFRQSQCAVSIHERGGGTFTHNVIVAYEESAIMIEFSALERVQEEDSAHASLNASRRLSGNTSPTGTISELPRPMALAPKKQKQTYQPAAEGQMYDAVPTFHENFIQDCSTAFEIDCGTPYSRRQRVQSQDHSIKGIGRAKSPSQDDSSGTGGGITFADSGVFGSPTFDPQSSPHASPSSAFARRNTRRMESKLMRSVLPDLQAVVRLKYRAHITNNVIQQCGVAFLARNGCLDTLLPLNEISSAFIPSALQAVAKDMDDDGEASPPTSPNMAPASPTRKASTLQERARRSTINSTMANSELMSPTLTKTASFGSKVFTIDQRRQSSIKHSPESEIGSGGSTPDELTLPPAIASANGSPVTENAMTTQVDLSDVTPVAANDQVQMALVDGNTMLGCEWGITVKGGGNARFQHNYIFKPTKGGMLVLDEGRGEFLQNIVKASPVYGLLVQQGGASGSDSKTPVGSRGCFTNLQENVFQGCKTGMTVCWGEGRYFKNACFEGDVGINLMDNATGLLESNSAFGNTRSACICSTGTMGVFSNQFYTGADHGAIEMRAENYRLPANNVVKNQFTPRWTKGEPAVRVKVPAGVSENKFHQDQTELFNTLREMHSDQLPECAAAGCTRIGTKDALANAIRRRSVVDDADLEGTGVPDKQLPSGKAGGVSKADAMQIIASTSVTSMSNNVRRKKTIGRKSKLGISGSKRLDSSDEGEGTSEPLSPVNPTSLTTSRSESLSLSQQRKNSMSTSQKPPIGRKSRYMPPKPGSAEPPTPLTGITGSRQSSSREGRPPKLSTSNRRRRTKSGDSERNSPSTRENSVPPPMTDLPSFVQELEPTDDSLAPPGSTGYRSDGHQSMSTSFTPRKKLQPVDAFISGSAISMSPESRRKAGHRQNSEVSKLTVGLAKHTGGGVATVRVDEEGKKELMVSPMARQQESPQITGDLSPSAIIEEDDDALRPNSGNALAGIRAVAKQLTPRTGDLRSGSPRHDDDDGKEFSDSQTPRNQRGVVVVAAHSQEQQFLLEHIHTKNQSRYSRLERSGSVSSLLGGRSMSIAGSDHHHSDSDAKSACADSRSNSPATSISPSPPKEAPRAAPAAPVEDVSVADPSGTGILTITRAAMVTDSGHDATSSSPHKKVVRVLDVPDSVVHVSPQASTAPTPASVALEIRNEHPIDGSTSLDGGGKGESLEASGTGGPGHQVMDEFSEALHGSQGGGVHESYVRTSGGARIDQLVKRAAKRAANAQHGGSKKKPGRSTQDADADVSANDEVSVMKISDTSPRQPHPPAEQSPTSLRTRASVTEGMMALGRKASVPDGGQSAAILRRASAPEPDMAQDGGGSSPPLSPRGRLGSTRMSIDEKVTGLPLSPKSVTKRAEGQNDEGRTSSEVADASTNTGDLGSITTTSIPRLPPVMTALISAANGSKTARDISPPKWASATHGKSMSPPKTHRETGKTSNLVMTRRSSRPPEPLALVDGVWVPKVGQPSPPEDMSGSRGGALIKASSHDRRMSQRDASAAKAAESMLVAKSAPFTPFFHPKHHMQVQSQDTQLGRYKQHGASDRFVSWGSLATQPRL